MTTCGPCHPGTEQLACRSALQQPAAGVMWSTEIATLHISAVGYTTFQVRNFPESKAAAGAVQF